MGFTISFDEVIKECNNKPNFIISPGCKTEIKCFFSDLRVDKDTIPVGWYKYDIRHGYSGGFCTVEPYVLVNHAGTILTQTEIRMNSNGYRSLCGRGGYTLV